MAGIYNIIISALLIKLKRKVEEKSYWKPIGNTSKCNIGSNVQSEISEKSTDTTNCRVCLEAGTVAIFDSGESGQYISETLSTVCAIEINEHDDLPKFLCLSCYNILQSTISFRNTAQHTDKLLRKAKLSAQSTKIVGTPESDYEYYDIENYTNFESPQYHCKRCNLNFDSFKSYSSHTKSDKHINLKVECHICKGMYRAQYIKNHILRHRLNPAQAYICEVCGKSFPVIASFRRHRAIHSFNLPYKCNLCPYKGRFKETLKMHMRTHTGEKPFACAQCPARYADRSNLAKHISRHKSENDIHCDICGRGYYRKKDLEQHIKVYHSGIKDHTCNICGKAFGYRKQMMKHQLNVHKREKMKTGRVPLYVQAEQCARILEDEAQVTQL